MAFTANEFIFDGIHCQEYDLVIYDLDSDTQDDISFASAVTIVEDRLVRRYDPLHYGVTNNKKLEFTLVFGAPPDRTSSNRSFDRYEMERVATWLTGHEDYKYLDIIQPDLQNTRYKCIITDLKPISIARLPWAYSAKVTCDSPYAYTFPQTFSFAVVGNTTGRIFNRSSYNGYYYPKTEISLPTGGDISIINKSDGNREFAFVGNQVKSNITIYVDNKNQIITNSQDLNLYDCFNLNFLRLKRGDNYLNIHGNGSVKITCEFPVNVGA